MRTADPVAIARLRGRNTDGAICVASCAVTLLDVDRLAAFLGMQTLSQTVVTAGQALYGHDHPCGERLGEVLERWGERKRVRGLGPEAAADLADAARVVGCMLNSTQDRIARHLSVELFGDSKRLEALTVHLDILTAESLRLPARHWSEVFSALGIRKEPQPLLLAGRGLLTLANGPQIPVAAPFVGIASDALRGYIGDPGWLLTVENLTTFHLAAAKLSERGGKGLLVYTAGMPSPSWLSAYQRLIDALPDGSPLYHWGDHDVGGYRIAARLARTCAERGRSLLDWQMIDLGSVDHAKAASPVQHRAMQRYASEAGWTSGRGPAAILLEQESLPMQLPA